MQVTKAGFRTLLILPLALAAGSHSAHADETIEELVAVVYPTEGNEIHGVVTFTEVDDGVRIQGTFSGLKPNAKHGFHIHQFGDARAANGTSAGGHFNPEGHPHAIPMDVPRHVGDLGNIEADGSGNGTYDVSYPDLTLVDGPHPIIGRGLIVHTEADDGGQPTGNAGPRGGIGVIGVANPDQN